MSDGLHTPEVRKGVLNWFIHHPKTTIALVLLILASTFLFVFDRAAASRVQRRIAAIRAKGEPVTVEDLNALDAPIPPEENLTTAIIQAVTPFVNLKPSEEMTRNLPVVGFAILKSTGQPMPDEQLIAANWYLAQEPEALRSVHDAIALKKSWLDYGWQSFTISSFGSELSRIRSAARLLMIESLVAAESLERQTAGQRSLDLFRIASATDNPYPNVVGFLTQLAIVAMAEDATSRAINRCGLDLEMLKGHEKKLADWQDNTRITRAIEVERVSFLAVTQPSLSAKTRLVTGGGPSGAMRFFPVIPSYDIASGLDRYAELLDAIHSPEGQVLSEARKVESAVASLPDYYMISKPHLSSIAYLIVLWLRSVGSTRALQAAIACERFRLANEKWPAQLEELVPEFIESVPKDPFDAAPIRYAIIPEGIKVWAIGDDLKDDGGNVARLEWPKKPTDWGWVILNPELRGKVRPENNPTTSAAAKN